MRFTLIDQFRTPSAADRPKFRWCWPGGDVDEAELAAELDEISRAGYGGVEISNMEAGLPHNDRSPLVCSWGTDHWSARIGAAVRDAGARGIGVDVTVGPNWPWSSPVADRDGLALAQHELVMAYAEADARCPVPRPESLDELAVLEVVTIARRLPGNDPGALDPDSLAVIEVTDGGEVDVRGDGWLVFAFWRQPTRQKAKGDVAPSCRHSHVIDHLSRAAVEGALDFLDRQLFARIPQTGSVVQELFEDSLELIHEGLLWTPSFVEKFRDSRGYDIRPYLPFVHRVDVSEKPDPDRADPRFDLPGGAGHRVRRDYHEALTDLWISEHMVPLAAWARARGLRTRVQAYGQSFDILAVSRFADVPETEDLNSNSLDFWRTIASAAHLSGAEKVSMEHGCVIGGDFMMTLPEIKRRADRAFAGGVNQIVTHVYAYRRADGARWPTWAPWSSGYWGGGFSDAWNSGNPQWRHLPALADYLARVQVLLRAGRPRADVAVYRDLHGYPNAHGNGTAIPFGVDPPEPLLNQSLSSASFAFDFVDPRVLAAAEPGTASRPLVVGAGDYSALVLDFPASARGVVDNTHAVDGAVARRIAMLVESGVPVVVVGEFPTTGAGYRDPDVEDQAVAQVAAQLAVSPRVRTVRSAAEVPAALALLGVRPTLDVGAGTPLLFAHRQTEDEDVWFIWNSSDRVVRADLRAASWLGGSVDAQVWDCWSGSVAPLVAGATGDGVEIELEPLGSLALVVPRGSTDGPHVAAVPGRLGPVAEDMTLGPWQLRAELVHPDGDRRVTLRLGELADWRTIPLLEGAAGTGDYSTDAFLEDRWLDGRPVTVDLGRPVSGGVQIRVNGLLASPRTVVTGQVRVEHLLRAGANVVEIQVSTTLKNLIDELSSRPEYAYFQGRSIRRMPAGLAGPVTLRLHDAAERT